MSAAVLAIAVFVAMEPVTALVHRSVMHGWGMGWHRSHHLPSRGGFEANDLYPVTFAGLTIALLCVGVFGGVAILVPVGIGITAYGVAYLFVHEVVIHRRVPFVRLPDGFMRPWREAHNVHHLFSAAPYGFLAPVVPRAVRERVQREPGRDRVSRPLGAAPRTTAPRS